MRVVYDISVLGHGHVYRDKVTGIPRVVDRLSRGLAAAQGLDLRFSARSLTSLRHAREYTAGDPELGSVPIIRSETNTVLAHLIEKPLVRLTKAGGTALSDKIGRRILSYALGFANGISPVIRPGDLDSVDVFHSPFDRLPDVTKSVRGLHRFITIYDLTPVLFPEFFDQPFRRHGFRHILNSIVPGDWICAISESTRDDLLEHRPDLDPSRVIVTPLAADRSRFFPVTERRRIHDVLEKYGIPDGPYVLSVNTLEPRKNLDRLIHAFVRLVEQERLPDLRLVLVGGRGWKTERLFDALHEADKRAAGRIIMTGFVDDADLAPLYSGAELFAYPSLYEGFGLPPLEAMQCGVPVITGNTSSLPEVVGDAGILVDPTDVDALADAMLSIVGHADRRAEFAERSRRRADRFSWERCMEITLEGYRRAVAEGR